MTDATRSQLQQAYRLIQQEELDKAFAILKPIVASQPNNADAWWLMANAVSEPEDARDALQNVLRLNPSNTQARELLDQLNEQFPELASAPSSTGDVSFDELFGDTAAPAPAARSTGSFNRGELEDLLGGEPEPAPVPQAENFDDIFGADTKSDEFGFESDPFATAEPGFVKEAEKPTKQDKKAGRDKKPKQEKVKAPKSTPQMDALEAERRANTRTSPFLLFVLLLIIVAVVGGGLTLAYVSGIIGGPRGGEVTPQATSVSAVSTAATPLVLVTSVATPDTGATVIVATPTTTSPETDGTAVATPDTGATAMAQVPTTAGTPAAETAAPNTTAGTTATAAPANPLQTLQLAGVSQTLIDTLGKSNFPNAKVTVVQSQLGSALQVQICSSAGPALQGRINQAMDIVAQQTVKVQNAVKAAGIEVVSCARPDTRLFRAFAPIEAIARYVDGGMADKSGYRASWIRG
jgi:cytoskeletal protein RodZ